MKTLKVRIVGICCLVDVNNGSPTKRVILPYDDMGHTETHIPFVEVAEGDVFTWTGLAPTSVYQHFNGSVNYLRWELAGHQVSFDTVDVTAPNLWQTYSYEQHVPSLKRVCPSLRSYPVNDCFIESPSPELIAGYFDIYKGSLDAGPLEEFFTSFDPERNWPPGRGTQSVDLTLPVHEGGVVISINSFDTSDAHDARIILKAEAETVRIGNLLLDDLTGSRPFDSDTSDHFMLYYNLADPWPPAEMPLPVKSLAPVNACSPTRWT
jgi:hypothetical protein